ncbi:LOW QUALITY PROTEIN: uncharacterized protein [Panulirus ornatus]|uniref:LOW QUALITY PROTEIN: uncharacterized protein n=1 Tax=Panulirus ornatus TaxID=150431 RepID=UPI003A86F78E
MTMSSSLLVLLLVARTQAVASWTTDVPRCSTECSLTGSPKLAYVPGRTYSYAYSGRTQVRVRGAEGGASVTGWSSRVELTWTTPCDVAIAMREPVVDGVAGDVADRFLERYPLVVAVSDGRVHHVCSHPEDDVWSINLKKGVASAFQNSLPYLPPTIFTQNITETDVVGRCSTHYKAETKRDKVVVRKTKDHRMCQERYPTPAETHVPWLKGPLPVEESRSVCEQEIKNGIYWSVKCEDKNVIRPSYGAYMYVVATQRSSLQYLSNSTQQPPAVSNTSRVHFVHKTLRYGYDALNKDPSLVDELDRVVSQICDKTRGAIERDAASLVVRALKLLRRVPEEEVEKVLAKIRSGFFTSCENQRRIESLFLDAVAFVHESGAVRVMVKELMEGRVTWGRTVLYTAALYLQPRPDSRAIEALTPIFESSQSFPYVTLAAASMVSTYCRHNPRCLDDPSVRSSAEALGDKLRHQCTSSSDYDSQRGALATLKALGNMGVMTPDVVKSTLKCLRTGDIETSVRVAAAQAFRKAKCYSPAVTQLMNIALDPSEDTEVRIASYLAGIPCAQKDIQDIVTKISGESNTQVRGFVLSHLHSVQRSSAPDKEELRYLLQNIDLPRDYDVDLRKYSRNVDMTYVASSLGVGAAVESNIIYVPGSYVPRSINLNFTAALGEAFVNVGEVGARVEGLESIIEEVFGPEGYLQRGYLDKVFKSIESLAGRKESEVTESSTHPDTGESAFDFSTISHFLSKVYGSGRAKAPRAEVFARLMGQEIAFASLTKDLRNVSVTDVLDSFPSYLKEMFGQVLHPQSDSGARTAQLSVDYILPTIQGTPVKLKLEGTGVLGMNSDAPLESLDAFNAKDSTDALRILPSLSLQVTGFIGYDCYLGRLGLEMNSTMSLSNGASLSIARNKSEQTELQLDLPQKLELFDVTSETYLMTGIRGRPDTRITPPPLEEDVRVARQACVAGPALGLRFCYDVNVADPLRSPAFPLGAPSIVRLYVEKMEPTMRGYLITVATRNKSGDEKISLKVETPGSSTRREAEATWSYSQQNESYIVSASVVAPNITSRVWSTIVASEDHKGLEAYAQYKSNNADVSRGIKVDFESKSPSGGKEYEVAMYVSGEGRLQPESKIIECYFTTRGSGPEVSVDVLFRTRNLLRRYVEVSLKAGSEVRYPPYSIVPLPTKLRNFEFHSGLGGWNMSSSIYRTKESDETVEFISVFKVMRRSEDLVSVKASYTMRGDHSTSFAVSTVITAKIGDEEYKASYDVFCEPTKVGALAQLVRPRKNTKILDLEVFAEGARHGHKAKFQLDVPGYIRAIKFESKLTLQEQYSYLVEVALRHGEHAVLRVDGPLLAKLTRPVIQLQADLKVSALPTGPPHRISTTVILAGNKRVLSFELNNQRKPVFGTEVNLSLESLQRTRIITTLYIPSLINHRLEVVVRSVVIHLNLNTTVLPTTSSARRLKSFVDVDLQRKKFKGELSWDADSDPSRKLSGEVTLATSSSTPRQATLIGNVIYRGDPYSYLTEVRLADPSVMSHVGGNFTTRLTTPSHNTVILDASCNVRQQDHTTRIDTRVAYSGLGNTEYRLTSSVDLEKLDGLYDYRLGSLFSFRSSGDQIRSTEDTLGTSLEAEFTLSGGANSSAGTCKAGKDTPLTLFSWDLLWHPEGRFESMDIDVDVAAIKNNVRAVRQVIASEVLHSSGDSSGRGSYHLLYCSPAPYTNSLVLRSPSRTMEGEAKYEPSGFRLRFYPNRNVSEAKYELTVQSSAIVNGTQRRVRFEGHLHHPGLSHKLLLGIQATTEGKTLQGKAELDIFPSTADKIVVTFNSTGISQNSMRTVAHMNSRVLKVRPVFTVVTSYAPHTIGMDLKIQETPSSRASLKTSAKYDRDSSSRSATWAFLMATDHEEPLVDISGVVEPEEAARCHGLMLKAVAHTSLLGTYDVHSKVCQPAFIELTSHKRASERVYTAKLGNQDFKTVEASLSLDHLTRQEEETGIVVARVMRATPTLVTSGFGFNSDALREVQSAVREVLLKVSRRCVSWTGQLYRHAVAEDLRNTSTSPSSQLRTLYDGTVEDLVHIYQDLAHDGIIPQYEDLQRLLLLDNRVLQVLVRFSHMAWGHLADLQDHYANGISRLIIAAYQEFSDPAQLVAQVLTSTAQWVETGQLSALLHHLQQHLEQTRIFKLMSMDVDTLREEYPEENEIIKLVASQVKEIMEENLEKFREKVLAHPSAQRVILWIRKHLDFKRTGITDLKNEVVRILIESLLIKVDRERNHFEVRVPLPHPVYSLGQAVKILPSEPLSSLATIMRSQFSILPFSVNDMFWAYYTLLPRRVVTDQLPPFSGTAMVIGDTEILTFDGAVLRVPRSPCEVLLAAYNTTTLTMSHPQNSASPRITLITGRTNVTVQPDFTVIINGQAMTGAHKTVGNVTVNKTHQEITIISPYMTVRVMRILHVMSVNASRWTFGRLVGLLGTYDGEVGNDRMMPSGRKASNLQELVRSWQKDPLCHTPAVSPVSATVPPVQRVVQCLTLLEVPSRCYPVVPPGPFIMMCYGARNACDAAHAYWAICSTKGVHEIFSLSFCFPRSNVFDHVLQSSDGEIHPSDTTDLEISPAVDTRGARQGSLVANTVTPKICSASGNNWSRCDDVEPRLRVAMAIAASAVDGPGHGDSLPPWNLELGEVETIAPVLNPLVISAFSFKILSATYLNLVDIGSHLPVGVSSYNILNNRAGACEAHTPPLRHSSQKAAASSSSNCMCSGVYDLPLPSPGPRINETPLCSTECSVPGSPKLQYASNYTYSYRYDGRSLVRVKDVGGSYSETTWSSQVKLTWLTPCDMAISIEDFKIDEAPGPPAATFLERYPLVVAVSDGRVHHVCSHPDDDVWSINFKKGVASAFQNSLPSLSTVNNGRYIDEIDVVGNCPTEYEIGIKGKNFIARKEKDHSKCKDRYPTPGQTPIPVLKGPQESNSICLQETDNGIYSAINCEDTTMTRPTYGAYREVLSTQESSLQYLSNSTEQPAAIRTLFHVSLVHKSLLYDYGTPKKDPSLVSQLGDTMVEICEKTKGAVEHDTATLVAKAMELLRRVPGEAVVRTLDDIRESDIFKGCKKVEGLFLDAVAFVHESGGVKVIVRELTEGCTTEGRAGLYAASLFWYLRPDLDALEPLRQLFESPRNLPTATLSAASMVNTYCRHNPSCYDEPTVQGLAVALSNRLPNGCSLSSDPERQMSALTVLKALGNMGVMTEEASKSVFDCLENEDAKTNIRVAAAQAFRQAKCNSAITERLVSLAMDPVANTEVRIASYLTAVPCAQQKDLNNIVANISQERNTQVRGFILSHLLNHQQSDAPDMENLRYLLQDVVVPRDYQRDIRSYSRHIDLSYFSPSLGVGAGVKTNLIYTPESSFAPRSVDLNLTAALGGVMMNIGEVGARFEGLEQVLEDVFGHDRYPQGVNLGEILHGIATSFNRIGGRQRSTDAFDLFSLLSKIYNADTSKIAQADVFLRLMGQEITFASLAKHMEDMNVDEVKDNFSSYVRDAMNCKRNATNWETDSVRTGQLYLDYSFPTIQGTPLKLQLEATAVVGLKMKGNFTRAGSSTRQRDRENLVEFTPSISLEANGFIGFASHLARTGITSKHLMSSNGGMTVKAKNEDKFELLLDLPESMDLINLETETHLTKSIKDRPDLRITPPPTRDVKFRKKSCIDIFEKIFGLRFCYDLNVTDASSSSNSLPLSSPSKFKLYLEKTEPSMRGYLLNVDVQRANSSKSIELKVATTGSSVQRETRAFTSYMNEGGSHKVSASWSSPTSGLELWATASNREDHKGLQVVGNYKYGKTEVQHGIKVDLDTRSVEDGKEHEINIYSSHNASFPPESHVFHGRLGKTMKGSVVSLGAESMTKNALRNHLDTGLRFTTEVRYGPDSFVPLQIKPGHVEFHGALGRWKVASSLRKTEESGDYAKYSLAFKLTEGDKTVVSADATHTSEGRLGQDFVSRNSAKVTTGSAVYKSSYDIHYSAAAVGATLRVIPCDDVGKIIDLTALHTRSGNALKKTFMLDLPEHMHPIKYASTLAWQRGGHYKAGVNLEYGGRVLLQADRSVQVASSSGTSSRNSLTFAAPAGGPQTISADLIDSPTAKVASLEVKTGQTPVYAAVWNMAVRPEGERTFTLKLLLPPLMNCTTKVVLVHQRSVVVTLDNLMFLDSPAPRRVNGSAAVDFERRDVEVDLYWDADRDVSKNAALKAQWIPYQARPGYYSVQGLASWMAQTYRLKVDLTAENQSPQSPGNYGLALTATDPSHKTVSLDMSSIVQSNDNILHTQARLSFKSLQDVEYSVAGDLALEHQGNSSDSHKVHLRLLDPSSGSQERYFEIKLNHQRTPEDRVVYLTIFTPRSSLRKPLTVGVSWSHRDNTYSLEWTTNVVAPATMFGWVLKTSPTGGIQSLESKVDMMAIRNLLRAVLDLLALNTEGHRNVEGAQSGIYRYHYHKPSPSAYSLLLQYPSRTAQAEASYSPSHASLTFYPNKDESKAKHEVGVQASHSYWDQQSSYQGHLSHPTLTRDVRVEVQVGGDRDSQKGTFKLDVFPDTEDEITGEFETTRISNNSIKIVQSLASRVLTTSPRFTIVTSYAPQTMDLDVKFQKTPSSQVSYQVTAKYDRLPSRAAAIVFRLLTEDGPVVDMSALVEPEEVPECAGWKGKLVAYTSLLGNYDIDAKACQPGFIEMTTVRRGKGDAYIAKFGVLKHMIPEVSLRKVDREGNHAIIMVKVEEKTPSIISADLAYDSERWAQVKNAVDYGWQKVVMSLETWVSDVYRHLQEEAERGGHQFPSSELVQVALEVRNSLLEIYQYFVQDTLVHQYETALHRLENSTVTEMIDFQSKLWRGFAELREDLFLRLLRGVTNWKEGFKGFLDLLKEVSVKLMLWLGTGEPPEELRHLEQELEHTRIFSSLKSKLDVLATEYPEEYAALLHVLDGVRQRVHDDLFNLVKRILATPAVMRTVDWIIMNYGSGDLVALGVEKLLNQLLNELGIAVVKVEENHWNVQIPLRVPLYSAIEHLTERNPVLMLENLIWRCASFIPNPLWDLIWSYFSFVPARVTDQLPSTSGTAMVIGDTEILTFDGAVLRVPRSPCEVLLAAYNTTTLTMSHPQNSARPRITLITGRTNVTVQPDFTVDINGREVSLPLTEGEVSIKETPNDMMVLSPFMTVRVLREHRVVLVNVFGRTIGRLAGLLGEAGNDWLMPSGKKASSLRELVRSWQEDPHCPTPDIQPVDLNMVSPQRAEQCRALLNRMSPCSALIPAQPFVKMCYASDDECDVAHAYRSICFNKGVQSIPPLPC